jgi:hypothetical protein
MGHPGFLLGLGKRVLAVRQDFARISFVRVPSAALRTGSSMFGHVVVSHPFGFAQGRLFRKLRERMGHPGSVNQLQSCKHVPETCNFPSTHSYFS